MTKTLTLFEHEYQEFPWTDRDLALIERLSQSIGTDMLKATSRN